MGYTLGISAFYHDSAAALIKEGRIIAAAQEERFSRVKADDSFPEQSILYVLKEAGITAHDLTAVVYYDKPFLTFERILETFLSRAPKGFKSFKLSMPVWLKEKLFLKSKIKKDLARLLGPNFKAPLFFTEHHLSHAASAFYPSPFDEAAILTIDGVGEWATTGIFHGSGNQIKKVVELPFPHSWGLFYSAVTYFLGFKVNSGEYKMMGLAPFGDSASEQTQKFLEIFEKEIVSIRDDGSLQLNLEYFGYLDGDQMIPVKKWERLFDLQKREPESLLTKSQANLAWAAQAVLEKGMVRLAEEAKKRTGSKNLVMAGGVALNCVANGKILERKIFDGLWVQPAAHDAGGAIGAALAYEHISKNREREEPKALDGMRGSYLGPSFDEPQILKALEAFGLPSKKLELNELIDEVAIRLSQNQVIGWFQGRMEWGPRALGRRSILASALDPHMQKKLNLQIKFRESFRPFAPVVLAEEVSEYFEMQGPSPYMLLTAPLKSKWRRPLPADYFSWDITRQLEYPRSEFPAITHVDGSARVQTVHQETNPEFWKLLTAYKKISGHSILVNTSFNVRGEPIVCTPEEALRCFIKTDMETLAIGPFLIEKKNLTQDDLLGLRKKLKKESAFEKLD